MKEEQLERGSIERRKQNEKKVGLAPEPRKKLC